MKNPTMTSALAGACAAIAVRSDLRAVNRITPAFADVSGETYALRAAGDNPSCSGNAPGSPPD